MPSIDELLGDPRWSPFSGWHDEHRQVDGTDAYRPAMMQVRDEFLAFVDALLEHSPRASCLQLGLGNCAASHEAWRLLYGCVLTIDRGRCLLDRTELPGCDTHERAATALAMELEPFDLLFIDAGHDYADVEADWRNYRPMVRPGGIVAFHDALPRAAYPEVRVHEFLATLPMPVNVIGNEVGIAWVRV